MLALGLFLAVILAKLYSAQSTRVDSSSNFFTQDKFVGTAYAEVPSDGGAGAGDAGAGAGGAGDAGGGGGDCGGGGGGDCGDGDGDGDG